MEASPSGLLLLLTASDAAVARLPDSTLNFMLFNSIWSALVALYIIITPRIFARAYHATIGLGVLALTALFWFAGSIAVAAQYHGCGSSNTCHVIQASAAFGFFLWAIFTGLAIMEGLAGRSYGSKTSRV